MKTIENPSKQIKCKDLSLSHYFFRASCSKGPEVLKGYDRMLDVMRKYLKDHKGLNVNVVPFPKEGEIVCNFILRSPRFNWVTEIATQIPSMTIKPIFQIN